MHWDRAEHPQGCRRSHQLCPIRALTQEALPGHAPGSQGHGSCPLLGSPQPGAAKPGQCHRGQVPDTSHHCSRVRANASTSSTQSKPR